MKELKINFNFNENSSFSSPTSKELNFSKVI